MTWKTISSSLHQLNLRLYQDNLDYLHQCQIQYLVQGQSRVTCVTTVTACITSGQPRSFGNVKNDIQLSRLSWKLKIRSNSKYILARDFLIIKVHLIQKCFKLQNQCIYENQSPPHKAIMVI